MEKIDKFYQYKNLYACPICGKKIRFHAGSLVCKKEHCFDISAKGYVNMMGATKPLKGYDRQFFMSRSEFFAKGYYEHILNAIVKKVSEIKAAADGAAAGADSKEGAESVSQLVLIDAGCGEGYYSSALAGRIEGLQIIAFDIAADAIVCAAKSKENVAWTIADVTNIPVKDGICDILLDVFTPASYKEFGRILKKGGYILKVIPGSNHLKELRKAAREQLKNKDYSGDDVSDYFEQHYDILSQETLTNTMPIDQETLKTLTEMTPLLFDVDVSRLDLSEISEITVEAQLIIGRA
ncbi:MAG: methyltransferase domain-containing protein [Eubacterium pyruvativorans]|uniref:putative RNA methyltransferase n=1 Tax=Eubacterium pyruvativorans TaxID=155865 RepID=UPI002A7ED086|nr:methyltransferase domain-containing protein [Eubacterium pyruvativorans]MDY4050106.1 methyltransferase domain-containing protein [Eubacterium pyruvativorans]